MTKDKEIIITIEITIFNKFLKKLNMINSFYDVYKIYSG